MNIVHGELWTSQKSTKESDICESHAPTVVCHDCEQTFANDDALIVHRETQHIRNLLDNTFVNQSLLKSNQNFTDCLSL